MKKLKYILLLFLLLPLSVQSQSLEDDLALPEGMRMAEMDSLVHSWTVSRHLRRDDACEANAENPFYTPEVYASRLKRLPNVVPMPYNDVVRQYIDHYCVRLRNTVSILLACENFYNPIFEEALESYQVPLEFKYLPVIESALNPSATSRVGAAGLWQFMLTTGKQYGLEVTSLIDERRDPVKSSYAAARYLRDLYNIFHDWTLVVASYNCGPGNVSKAIKRAGGAMDYWSIYNYLPRETQGYVPAFIAANYVMNYYCNHNICPAATRLPAATDTIQLNRHLQMNLVAEACQIGMEELKALNPQYRTDLIPGESHACALRLPADKVGSFIELSDTIFARQEAIAAEARPVVEVPVAKERSSARASKTVKVRRGDTLGAIAKRNHTTVAKLRALNGIKGNNIQVGKTLKVR